MPRRGVLKGRLKEERVDCAEDDMRDKRADSPCQRSISSRSRAFSPVSLNRSARIWSPLTLRQLWLLLLRLLTSVRFVGLEAPSGAVVASLMDRRGTAGTPSRGLPVKLKPAPGFDRYIDRPRRKSWFSGSFEKRKRDSLDSTCRQCSSFACACSRQCP